MLIYGRVLLLIVFCIISDYTALQLSSANHYLKAILDSSIHFIVGAWCWYIITNGRCFVEVLSCGVLSSFIDIDHFIAARSFSLKAALSLPNRPILHAVAAIPVAALFLGLIGQLLLSFIPHIAFLKDIRWLESLLSRLPWIIIIAWGSHQLRDSIRRGLWIWPFGSLPPTPYWLYVGLVSGVSCLLFFAAKSSCEDSSDSAILEV